MGGRSGGVEGGRGEGGRGAGGGSDPCPACGADLDAAELTISGVPVHASLLLDSAAQARAFATGELELAECRSCGFVTNVAFDPTRLRYQEGYEDSQAHSPRFLEFARTLAEQLTRRYLNPSSRVVEIGCGKGDFLTVLCETAGCSGIGYDPAYGIGALAPRRGVTFVREQFTGEEDLGGADLLVCRHTLEHVGPVRDFVAMLRCAAGDRTPLYLEVPDAQRIFEDGAFWDVYYEHCSYFGASSLERLVRSCGFDPVEVRRGFADQYLMVEARPAGGAPPTPDDGDALGPPAAGFGDLARFGLLAAQRVAEAATLLDGAAGDGHRVVLWGAGSKAVGYLAALAGHADAVLGVVDVNPRKQGRFLPGTGLRVLAPLELTSLGPDLVVLLNPVYEAEVAQMLDEMRSGATLVIV